MTCPTCGGTEFSHGHDDAPVQCVGCNLTLSRDDLLRENGAQIEAAVNDMTKDIRAEAIREFIAFLKRSE